MEKSCCRKGGPQALKYQTSLFEVYNGAVRNAIGDTKERGYDVPTKSVQFRHCFVRWIQMDPESRAWYGEYDHGAPLLWTWPGATEDQQIKNLGLVSFSR